MNKKWKVTGCVVLLLVMLFPLTVSGTGGKEPVGAAAMEIHWHMRIKSGEETAWWKQEVEEKLNVRIIPNGIDTNDKEKTSVMLAAGEFPDCGTTPAALGSVYDLYDEGVTRGIPEKMIRKYAPNYAKTLDADFPVGWLLYRNKDNDKEFVSLTGVHIANDTYGFAPGFRVDWAKNVGFELPNYEQKKIPLDRFNKTFLYYEDVTLEWLERLLKAFRDGDPDGNGKNDTIPWSGCKHFHFTWRSITEAFGVSQDFNVMVDGKLYEWCIAPGYKDFLKLAARWYREGLVDKEFATIDHIKAWEKIATKQVGASVVCTDYAGADYARTRPPNNWVDDEELATGAQVVLLAPPIGPTGKRGSHVWSPVSPLSYTFMVGKQVSDEKLEKILEILDYTRFSTLETFVYDRWGKPGVHFDWEGTPWESSPIGRKYEDVAEGYPKEGGFGNGYPAWITMERMKFIYPKHLFDYYGNFLTAEIGQNMTTRPYKWDLFAETNLTELNKKYKDTLNTIKDEFQLGVITGEIDLDAEWDSYVAKYRKNGGDEIIAEYMKAPIVSELRKGKTVY